MTMTVTVTLFRLSNTKRQVIEYPEAWIGCCRAVYNLGDLELVMRTITQHVHSTLLTYLLLQVVVPLNFSSQAGLQHKRLPARDPPTLHFPYLKLNIWLFYAQTRGAAAPTLIFHMCTFYPVRLGANNDIQSVIRELEFRANTNVRLPIAVLLVLLLCLP